MIPELYLLGLFDPIEASMPTTDDLAGHVGYVLILLGMIGLARRRAWGWLARFAGEAVWVAIGIRMGMSSIWLWGCVFLVIDLVGFARWRRVT